MFNRGGARAVAVAFAAALTLLLLGTLIASALVDVAVAETKKPESLPAAPPKAEPVAAPLKIEALSAAQLASMPASTVVMLSTGRKVALDVLRQEHAARLVRFGQAAKLGSGIAAGLKPPLSESGARSGPSAPSNGPGVATLVGSAQVPMKPNPHAAADYQAFCKAAAASACLYFPGPTAAFRVIPGQDPNILYDSDPLVTDPGVCNSQGGIIQSGQNAGCAYGYPYTYTSNFNPGPASAQGIGSGVTSTSACNSPATVTVDPKGAIVMAGNFLEGTNSAIPATLTCVVKVYVP